MLERGLRGAGGSGAERIPPSARRAAAVFLGLQLGANVALYPREAAFAASTERLLADVHIPAGAFLREHVPAHEWIVVVVDAGAIPYVSGLKTVDFGGLNDEFLSRRFIDKIPSARIVDYFYARNPAALVFTSRSRDFVIGPEPVPVTDDPGSGVMGSRRSSAAPTGRTTTSSCICDWTCSSDAVGPSVLKCVRSPLSDSVLEAILGRP